MIMRLFGPGNLRFPTIGMGSGTYNKPMENGGLNEFDGNLDFFGIVIAKLK